MTSISFSRSAALIDALTQTRAQMDEVGRQMASGKKASTYSGLGENAGLALIYEQRLAEAQRYKSTSLLSGIRIDETALVVDRLGDIVSLIEDEAGRASYSGAPDRSGRELALLSGNYLKEMVSLLNNRGDSHYIFSGTKGETPPVASAAELLHGDASKAGLRQFILERRQADIGDGMGRYALTTPTATMTEFTRDHGNSPFGLKLLRVENGVSGLSANPKALSEHGWTFAFGAPGFAGERLSLHFGLPDGSESRLDIVLKKAGQTPPPGESGVETVAIDVGATAAATSAAFSSALRQAAADMASGRLAAASAHAAAAEFFDEAPPQRVDGPPFATATALRDGGDDSIAWYRGDDSPDARGSAAAVVDSEAVVFYGLRADHALLRESLKQTALLASDSFDAKSQDISDRARREVVNGARNSLRKLEDFDGLPGLSGELAFVHGFLGALTKRHEADRQHNAGALDDLKSVDKTETGIKLLTLQNHLAASFEATSVLLRLSLVHYID